MRRIISSSSSIIDDIYTTDENRIIEYFVSDLSISDHFPICFTRALNAKSRHTCAHNTIKYRSFKSFDRELFCNDLNNCNLQEVEMIHDPDVALNVLYDRLNNILSAHAPLKEKRVKFKHQPDW